MHDPGIRILLIAGALCVGCLAVLASEEERPSVPQILARAIERARLNEEAGNEVKFNYTLESFTEQLDSDGNVEKTDEWLYRSHHIGFIAYERLESRNGRALTAEEVENERKREQRFRAKLAEGKARHNDADERVAFDEELVSRYDVTLEGLERPLDGRTSYVLAFTPRSTRLPERNQVDVLLNRAEGKLWIDTETFEIARLEFSLREKIRKYLIMGSISKMTGRFERRPVGDEIWLSDRFDFYVNGRAMFRPIHVRARLRWSDFHRIAEAADGN